ncbi:MAG: phage tail family protein [Ignavibacteriaceae bacterium]|nr:phage tail family protein [Ignavibacteriaceae bacterium]
MYSFNFMGSDSFINYGIVIEKRPIIPKPQRNIQYIDVPGRSGSLKVDDATYKDIIIPIQCSFNGGTAVADQADLIKTWLDSGEGSLILSNQLDKYYTAHVSDQVDISQEFRVFGKFLVNFRCKPFKYAVVNTPIFPANAGTINNPGSVKSDPVIVIIGSGNITLTINGITISLTGISGSITIDSAIKDAYQGTTLQNNLMTGDFPILVPGNNTISWTGSVSSVQITPNWRWL